MLERIYVIIVKKWKVSLIIFDSQKFELLGIALQWFGYPVVEYPANFTSNPIFFLDIPNPIGGIWDKERLHNLIIPG